MPRLVLVDDNRTLQQVVKLSLSDAKVEVSCFDEPATALEALAEDRADLILVDTSLPEIDGYDFCRRLASDPDLGSIPVVLLTGATEDCDERKALSCGAVERLQKPFGTSELIQLVERLLGTKGEADREGSVGSDRAAAESGASAEGRIPVSFPAVNTEVLFDLDLDSCRPHFARVSGPEAPVSRAAENSNER